MLVAAGALSRRGVLRAMARVGAAAVAAPLCSRRARSDSGAVDLLMWADEIPDVVLAEFTAATGISVNKTPFTQHAEQAARLQAAGGEGFDLCMPRCERAPEFKELGFLAPFDPAKLTAAGKPMPGFAEAAQALWTWDGGLHFLPQCWGAEALSWRTDKWAPDDPLQLSYGDLWRGGLAGHVQARPHSLLLGIGLWLDASGKLASDRMRDAYRSPADMRRIYDQVLRVAIERKGAVRQFWDSGDMIRHGLLEGDVWIGQTWDAPVLALQRDGKPVAFQAPKEGAVAWLDGFALLKTAKNVDQAYALINHLMTPAVAAQTAEASGYNPVIEGAVAGLTEARRKSFETSYPGESVARLWHRVPEPAWLPPLRTEYVDRLKAA